jgi:hypothetical protein
MEASRFFAGFIHEISVIVASAALMRYNYFLLRP